MRSDYDESLLLGYVEGELSDGERRKVEAWMQDDPRLEALLRGMARDRQALRDEPTPDPPDWLLDDVHHGLERSMLLDPKADQAAVVVRQRHVVRKLLAGFAVAAMVLLACGVVLYSVLKINNEPVEWPNTVADATSEPEPEPEREEATDGTRNAVADAAQTPRSRASDPAEPSPAPPADESAGDLPESLAKAYPEAPRALPPQAREAQGETDADAAPDAADPPVLADTPALAMEAAKARDPDAAGIEAETETLIEPGPDQAAQAPAVALGTRRTEQPAFDLARQRHRLTRQASTDDADATDALDADLMAFGRQLDSEPGNGAATGADRTETLDPPPVNFGLVQGGPSGRPMQLRIQTEDLGRSIRRLSEVAGRLDRASLTAATVIHADAPADDAPMPGPLGGDPDHDSMELATASPRRARPLIYRLVLPAEQLSQAIDLLQSPDVGYQRVDVELRPTADPAAELYRELWPRTEPDYQRILRARLDEAEAGAGADAPEQAGMLVIPILVERQARVESAAAPADANGEDPATGSTEPSPTEAAPPADTAAPDPAQADDDGDHEADRDAPTPSKPSP
jgi:hypothetical protein